MQRYCELSVRSNNFKALSFIFKFILNNVSHIELMSTEIRFASIAHVVYQEVQMVSNIELNYLFLQ